jgi:hypothetical protein
MGKVSGLWRKFKPEFHAFAAIRLNLGAVASYSMTEYEASVDTEFMA